MPLTPVDVAIVKGLWKTIKPKANEIGSEVLGRMLTVYPQTKAYFSEWKDLSPGSAQVKKHGLTIFNAISNVVNSPGMNSTESMTEILGDLSDLHAYKLRVDPANFRFLSQCVMVSISMYFPKDFTPEVQLSVDKFFVEFIFGLSERYR